MFRNRYHVRETGGISIDGCRRGEDNVGDVMHGHCAEESNGAANVDTVVFEWDIGGFAYGLRESIDQYRNNRLSSNRKTYHKDERNRLHLSPIHKWSLSTHLHVCTSVRVGVVLLYLH